MEGKTRIKICQSIKIRTGGKGCNEKGVLRLSAIGLDNLSIFPVAAVKAR